jgi:uncharacterized beta-barrel protein YwiB (DUF1934 family)
MAIIKEKTVKIISQIDNYDEHGLPSDEPEISESVCSGFLKITEDEFIISYTENSENGRTVSDITVTKEGIRVKRCGALTSNMLFSENVTDKSLYEVSPYKFDVEVYTRKIRNTLTRDGGRIDIFYDMTIGGAKKSVRMKIEC